MGSIELVEVGHKYGTVYVIPSQLDSYVIFDNKTKTKTIHQVLNNTNNNYIVTLYTMDDKEFEFTKNITNIYTYENDHEKQQINNLQFDIQNSDTHIIIGNREFKKGTVRRKDTSTDTANESTKQIDANEELTMKNERLSTEVQECKQHYIKLSQEFKEYQDSSNTNCTTELQRIDELTKTLLSSETCTTELEKINIQRSKENKELAYYKNLCSIYNYSFLVLFIVCCIFYFTRYNRTNKL